MDSFKNLSNEKTNLSYGSGKLTDIIDELDIDSEEFIKIKNNEANSIKATNEEFKSNLS